MLGQDNGGRTSAGPALSNSAGVPLAILGDSDSQSYQVTLSSPPGTRFGKYSALTFQWPEVLARLRPLEIDLGNWGVRGTRRSIAEAMDRLGFGGRFPRKEDYLHNWAFGGAACDSLTGYNGRLAPRLVIMMNREREKWSKGVVVIMLGVNDFGHSDSLDLLAEDPVAPEVQTRILSCLKQIQSAVKLIHRSHPSTRIVLVGVLGDTNDPSQFPRWHSAKALSNISAGLDVFDQGLAAMALSDQRIAFFDQRRWFAKQWGGRGEQGEPNYKTVTIGGEFTVSNSAGNEPTHALTADEHAGLVWNALWAQALVTLMNSRFEIGVAPIGEREITALVKPAFALMAPDR